MLKIFPNTFNTLTLKIIHLEHGNRFYSYDVSILVSFIANHDIREFDLAYDDLLKNAKQEIFDLGGSLTGLPSKLPGMKQLFDFIFSIAYLLDDQIDRLPDQTGLKAFANATVQQHCNTPFKNLLGIYKVGKDGRDNLGNYKFIEETDTNAFPSLSGLSQKYTKQIIEDGLVLKWVADGTLTDVYSSLTSSDYHYAFGTNSPTVPAQPIHIEQWLKPALKAITAVYKSLSKVFYKIISESINYLEETLDEWRTHTPHMSLYLSFLKLFRFAQDHLNGLKEDHVNFYYREILRLQERPSRPDEVFAIIELAKHIDEFLLEEGVAFKGGKDSEGNERIYKTRIGTAINKASVSQLKAVYKNPITGKIYTSLANTSDGIEEPPISEDGSWKPFGPVTDFVDIENNVIAPLDGTEQSDVFPIINQVAEVGFAIASPNLFLKGGTRRITIDLTASRTDIATPTSWNTTNFKILFTGEEGWIEKTLDDDVDYLLDHLKFICTLKAEDPKIVPYDSAIHGGTFQTNSPIVKVVLVDDGGYVYNDLKKFKITKASTTVEVSNLKDILVQNEIGRLDLSNPILPFGALAKVGSSLIIGSKEVFQKKLLDSSKTPNQPLGLNIIWEGLEDVGNAFKPSKRIQVTQGYLKGNTWIDPAVGLNLASLELEGEKLIPVNNVPSIEGVNLSKFDFSHDETYTPTSKDGFIRINLKDDFGQKDYFRELPRALIELAKTEPDKGVVDVRFRDTKDTSTIDDDDIVLTDPPYIPSFKGLSINYTASSTFLLGTQFENRAEQFFHLHSFGQRERHTELNGGNAIRVLPLFENEGDLMIGLKGLEPQQSVSILFQIAEGTAEPLKAKQEVEWSFLYNNNWKKFTDTNDANYNDQTNGLLQSGLVSFFLPKKINADNTWLETGHIWIKASVKNHVDAICNIIEVKAQTVRLRFEDQDNAEDVLASPLAAESVKKLLEPIANIKKIKQPFTSFGGKLKEQQSHFHKRISERLRHKDRAITIWDYEHLILEEFPEIYRAKCLNHTHLKSLPSPNEDQKTINEVAPGHVLLVTIPDLQQKNAVATLKPYTSLNTISKISDFIKKRTTPHAKVEVINPLFEEIQLDFQIQFRENIDFTLYQKKLNQDILKFLSPWAFKSETQQRLEFGGIIYKSVLLDYIEELSYVDFVTEFKMNHIGPTKTNSDIEEAIASSPRSILVSIAQHEIKEVENCL